MFRSPSIPTRAAALALAVAAGGFGGAAHAAAANYRFEVLHPQVSPSRETVEVRVRLVRGVDGQPVTDAPVQVERFGMWPTPLHKTNRPWMAHAIGPAVAEAVGVYRLPAELPMTGDYRLTLAARVAGEAEVVRGTVVIRAAHR